MSISSQVITVMPDAEATLRPFRRGKADITPNHDGFVQLTQKQKTKIVSPPHQEQHDTSDQIHYDTPQKSVAANARHISLCRAATNSTEEKGETPDAIQPSCPPDHMPWCIRAVVEYFADAPEEETKTTNNRWHLYNQDLPNVMYFEISCSRAYVPNQHT